MVKDFDFDVLKLGKRQILVVSGMESLEECNWYRQLLTTDNNFAGRRLLNNFVIVSISNSSLLQIETEENLEKYLEAEKRQE